MRINKEVNKQPPPWTDDEILQNWRFCNVRREDDKVTRWIAANWRTHDTPDLWFAMCVARFINRIETLDKLGFPVPWESGNYLKQIKELMKGKEAVWGNAYIVSTNGNAMAKDRYIVNHVLSPLWLKKDMLRPTAGDTLATYAGKLMAQHGLSGFMAGQVVADIKYVHPLKKAVDWNTWAISGPGSKRGMNRLKGRDPQHPTKEAEWRTALLSLQNLVNQELPDMQLHAQDLQSCLCEFDKYERILWGEGRPKQRYTGVGV